MARGRAHADGIPWPIVWAPAVVERLLSWHDAVLPVAPDPMQGLVTEDLNEIQSFVQAVTVPDGQATRPE